MSGQAERGRRAQCVLAFGLLLLLAGCASNPRLEGGRPAAQQAGGAPRILLTVPQHRFAALPLTGAPDRRYLRRGAYGPSPAVDRVLDALARDHSLRRVEGWPIRSLDVYCEVFAVRGGVEVDALLRSLAADQRVQLAQRMNSFRTLGAEPRPQPASKPPAARTDDTYADLQPSAAELGLLQAHRVATGKGVLVAVIDSAVDAAHPDLEGRVSLERDLVDGRRAPRYGEVHGTAVAGVIGSVMNNHEGIVGVAPEADIAALRACWPVAPNSSGAACSSFSLAQALEIAIEIHARVINLSLTGPHDPLLDELLDAAIARGAIVVAAQPGPGSPADSFPSSHPDVLVARASSEPFVSGASRSRLYSLPAPAREILTTVPERGYAFLSGTSFAAAQVSGVVALLEQRRPGIDVQQAAALLSSTTVQLQGDESVNACRALEKLMARRLCGPDFAGREGETPGPALAQASARAETVR